MVITICKGDLGNLKASWQNSCNGNNLTAFCWKTAQKSKSNPRPSDAPTLKPFRASGSFSNKNRGESCCSLFGSKVLHGPSWFLVGPINETSWELAEKSVRGWTLWLLSIPLLLPGCPGTCFPIPAITGKSSRKSATPALPSSEAKGVGSETTPADTGFDLIPTNSPTLGPPQPISWHRCWACGWGRGSSTATSTLLASSGHPSLHLECAFHGNFAC